VYERHAKLDGAWRDVGDRGAADRRGPLIGGERRAAIFREG